MQTLNEACRGKWREQVIWSHTHTLSAHLLSYSFAHLLLCTLLFSTPAYLLLTNTLSFVLGLLFEMKEYFNQH